MNQAQDTMIQMDERKTAYFKNGVLFDVNPKQQDVSLYENRDIAYQASVYNSDGHVFDLLNTESIRSFTTPNNWLNVNALEYVSVFDLSYILKLFTCSLSGSNYRNVIIALVPKCFEMMIASPIQWLRSDFLRVIRCFWTFGLENEGTHFEIEMKKKHPGCFLKYPDLVKVLPDGIDKEEWLKRVIQKDKSIDENHSQEKIRLLIKWKRTLEYEEIVKLMPEIAPKTQAAYTRMRSQNTKKYQEIKKHGIEKGIVFFEE